MNVPVAVFIYKRPELTQEIFEVLKVVKPSKLFVFADGPQFETETELCSQTRGIFENVEWTNDVYRDYLSTNIGLGKRITSGLNYVFSQVERAIILEDDCIPNEQFFSFCEEMLERYRDDEKVMHINGTNLLTNHPALKNHQYGYFFSRFSMPWGWASWARAWKKYNNFTMYKYRKNELLEKLSEENRYLFDAVFSSCEYLVDGWDNRWLLSVFFNDGYVITPKSNLISNKGNDSASSYMPENSNMANLELQHFSELLPPPFMIDENLNCLCENAFVELANEFKYYNLNMQKSFVKTREIVDFLNPIKIERNYTLNEVKEFIVEKFPPYTALPLDFYESVLDFFPKYNKLENGVWVEVGVWKGGGALFFRSLMNELGIDKNLFLYDTFGKVPPMELLTKPKDLALLAELGAERENAKKEKGRFLKVKSFFKRDIPKQHSYLPDVKELFFRFDLNSNVTFIASDVHKLTEKQIPEYIAFLFIDVDFYEPVYRTLELFYDNLIQGGVLIIDDYYMEFLNCKEAVDDFFQSRNIDLAEISERFSSFAVKIIKP